MLTLAQGQNSLSVLAVSFGFSADTLVISRIALSLIATHSCSSQVAMSAPSTNPVGVLPIADAASVPVPSQSWSGSRANRKTSRLAYTDRIQTSIAPDAGGTSASGSRRYDPMGTCGPLLLQQNNLANVAVVHQHGLPLETIGYAELRHRQILYNTQQRHMEHLQEVHAENYNEVQQMRIALAIAQSEFSRLEAAGVTNSQAQKR